MVLIRLVSAISSIFIFACGAASAQTYPVKPVRVVVVFAPGGATDIVGRLAYNKVSEQLQQQFIIDNRAGASGTIGAAIVARSPADGYTLMVYSTTLIASAHLYKNLTYDAVKDFTGITPIARLVLILGVHPSMPVQTVNELIALAKSRPNEISYATAGVGALQHLATVRLSSIANIKMIHVPYKGGGPAGVAMAGGETQVMLTPISELLPHIKSNRVRAIAVSSAERHALFPKLPTIGESLKGFDFTSWMGTFAPAGTPRDIVEKLNAELKKAVADPGVAGSLNSQALDPMHLSVDAFAALLKTENQRYGEIVKQSGISLQ